MRALPSITFLLAILTLSAETRGQTLDTAPFSKYSATVVVLPLDRASAYAGHDWMRGAFAEVIASRLTGAQGLRVLDIHDLETAQLNNSPVDSRQSKTDTEQPTNASLEPTTSAAQQDISSNERTANTVLRSPTLPDHPSTLNEALACALAQRSGADVVVWGQVNKQGDDVVLTLTLTRAADARPLGTLEVKGVYEDPSTLLNEAVRAILAALRRTPDAAHARRLESPVSRDRYALTLFGRGLDELWGISKPADLAGAQSDLARSLRIDPNNPLFHSAMAQLHARLGRPADAYQSWTQAVHLWPSYPQALRRLARIDHTRGDIEQAIEHLEAALEAEPANLDSRFELGQLLAESGQAERALALLQEVVDASPGRAVTLQVLALQARLRAIDGDLEGAATSYRELLGIDPESRVAKLGLGAISLRRGALEEAAGVFTVLAQSERANPLPAHILGEIALMQQNTERAIEMFREEALIRPSHPSAWYYLGETYRRAGNTEKVIEAESMAHVRNQSEPVHLNNLGVAQVKRGDLETATMMFRHALELAPGWALLHQNLGLTFAARGMWSSASESLATALELQPGLTRAQFQLGLLFARDGKLKEARGAFETVVITAPDFAEAYYNLGVILLELERPQQAIRAWQEYLELSSNADDADAVRRKIHELRPASAIPAAADRAPGATSSTLPGP